MVVGTYFSMAIPVLSPPLHRDVEVPNFSKPHSKTRERKKLMTYPIKEYYMDFYFWVFTSRNYITSEGPQLLCDYLVALEPQLLEKKKMQKVPTLFSRSIQLKINQPLKTFHTMEEKSPQWFQVKFCRSTTAFCFRRRSFHPFMMRRCIPTIPSSKTKLSIFILNM